MVGSLPRPELPPGPQRELNQALHDLHHRAGWPSLRVMARDAGCSHTTVSGVFSSNRLPTWGVLELLVESLGGNVPAFRELWLAAGCADGSRPATALLAGRAAELAAVRRHLESGSGMLIVSGEAGLGKTRLVNTAAGLAADEVFVATGACLPLSSSVPLLPVADVLRSCWEADGGAWLREGIGTDTGYIAEAVSVLLPEVAGPDLPRREDAWSVHRLFTGVASVLRGMAARRPLAVLVEDLHWADVSTLDLLEHLVSRSATVPVVATWRLDDEVTPASHDAWLARLRRDRRVDVLGLSYLSEAETAAQLTLLLHAEPEPRLVEAIHRRSLGHPLFTEQLLTAQQQSDTRLPDLLADLLDRRIGDLTGPAWDVAVALAVADRPLDDDELATATRVAAPQLASGLHQLRGRHLVGDDPGPTRLRHPLLAEAARRRLTGPEVVLAHRNLATALATGSSPQAGEVAEHWRAAGEDEQELLWRIRAAEAAGARFAWPAEGEHWARALELWPSSAVSIGSPPVRRCDAYVRVMDALQALDLERAAALAEEALLLVPGLEPVDAAAIWARAGHYIEATGDPVRGLALVEQAVDVLETLPPSEAHVRALLRLSGVVLGLGRYAEARAAVQRAAEVVEAVGDRGLEYLVLIDVAWFDAQAGDLDEARALAARAAAMEVEDPLPQNEINATANHTDLLLMAAGSAEEIEAVAERGLACARSLGIETYAVSVIRSNLALAFLRAGLVERAGAVVDPVTQPVPHYGQWAAHLERSAVDLRRGLVEEARTRFAVVADFHLSSIAHRVEVAAYGAEIDLWDADPRAALDRLLVVLAEAAPGEAAQDLGPALVLAARAAADQGGRDAAALADELDALLAACAADPFGKLGAMAARRALPATWRAERDRLLGTLRVEPWVEAASAWDELGRPHDAAYCRWRAAQVALRDGQATVATKLLRRAARDAREHVPLTRAIEETAGYARSREQRA